MYVSDKRAPARNESIQDRSAYPERIVVAQFIDRDSLDSGQNIIEDNRRMLDGISSDVIDQREQRRSYTIKMRNPIERMEEEEAQKRYSEFLMKIDMERAGDELIEQAALELECNDRIVRAEACQKISTVAQEFPKRIPEEIIEKVLSNLANNETPRSHSFLLPKRGIEPSIFDIFERVPVFPAHYYAKSALVSLGERSMPYLKQALIEGNRQMKEKVFEVLYEISLNSPELITDDFLPLLAQHSSDKRYKAQDIIRVIIKASRSTSESAAESEDKE